MKILVFGRTGQVATELQRLAGGDQLIALGREQADLSDPEACAAQISDVDAVINAAAYTAVDAAEDGEALANIVNGEAPAAMARACAALGIPFVHISTDYVFDGTGTTPWQPADATGPLGAYGRSKLLGEAGIAAAGGSCAILRTSWVFSAHGGNFVKTMLRLSETRDTLGIVADQIGGPTPAAAIAGAVLTMARQLNTAPQKAGIYHFAGAPDVSWADFAAEIFAQAGRKVAINKVTTSDYPTPAKRPGNSRMECSALADAFGIARPDWRKGLADVLNELKKLELKKTRN
ncbi:MAG: dTDP-4-dehydrorhamnose reductase [Rhodobacteraceae bacterium]|nr:dTDP-4-dehydrorhamnose reductase [Paracoccaceae bacterium]PHR61732.1 MAG: dTDP-4-dehydrorhamnose reductase [Robiginitomaculum sp.]